MSKNEPDNEDVDLDLGHVLLDVWAIVRRRKWHVIGSMVLGLVLGALYLAQATPYYRATTKIVVLENNPMSLPFEGQRGSPQSTPRDDYLNTHAYVIRTPAIVELVSRPVWIVCRRSRKWWARRTGVSMRLE
jgi:uncharacterized protein involved in exopolysaccharide biosynthesis